jgi:uncharacterized protein YjbJ (UPF0337 family)
VVIIPVTNNLFVEEEEEPMASKVLLKTNWNRIKTQLREKYPQLSETDLVYTEGKEDQLLEKLQTKTHKTRKELEQEIEGLLQTSSAR